MEAIRPLAARKGVILRSGYDLSSDAIEVDGARVQQALINLIDNALKHSKPGSSVTVCARQDSNEVVL